MKKPNKAGLNDMAVLDSRKTFGINRLSKVITPVGEGRFFSLSLFKKVQFWVVTILILCSVLSFISLSDAGETSRYRALCNLICVFTSYIVSISVFYFLKQHTQKVADDQVNIYSTSVQVLRNGKQKTVSIADVVVSDIVVLEEGATVPADGILLKSAGVRVDESTVGGNNDVFKRVGVGPLDNGDNIYPADWMIGGSVVVEGNGIMKVTRVGDQTEFGRTSRIEKDSVYSRIPFVFLVDKISNKVAIYIFLYALLVYVGCHCTGTDVTTSLYKTLSIPINFILVVLPIVVPYAVSIITLVANKRFSKMGVKVKDMNSPFAIGMVSSIITGRFGLLSSGDLKVVKVLVGLSQDKQSWVPLTAQSEQPKEIVALFSRALSLSTTANFKDNGKSAKRHATGAAEETAIINWMSENGIDVDEYRSDVNVLDRVLSMRESGISAVLIEGNGENFVFVQGKPKEVFANCRYVQGLESRVEVDAQIKDLYRVSKNESPYVVSVAYARVPSSLKKLGSIDALKTIKMTLVGMVYIDDHIRQGVSDFVYSMENSNISVKMVTSLRKETAVNLAYKSNVLDDHEAAHIDEEGSVCLTSQEIMLRNNGRIPYEAIEKQKVISQVALSDRFNIVKTMQQNGDIVAVVASGLRVEQLQEAADVAITMRSEGSDVHSGNEVTISHNHLHTLKKAIMMGRALIRCEGRIYSLMTGLFSAVLIMNTIGILCSGKAVISVVQIFWLDLVCVGIATLALLLIREEESLNFPSKRVYVKFAKSTDFMVTAITIGIYNFVMVFAFWLLSAGMDITHVSDIWTKDFHWCLPTDPAAQFSVVERSMLMTLLIMCIFWSVITLKVFGGAESHLSHLGRYSRFFGVALMIPISHFLMIHFGGEYFFTCGLSAMDWVYLTAFTSVLAVYVEIRQFFRRHKASAKR